MSGIFRRRTAMALASGLTLATAACASDRVVAPTAARLDNASEGRGVFQRYVAIGTSVSAGVQSDGLIAATQATSWPAQLAAMAGRTLAQPYIDGTGCRSPLAAPLMLGKRLSGEDAGTDPSTLGCSPLRGDVQLPVDNVSLNGARAKDALFTTAQNITDQGNAKIYGRVLEPGATQVSTMMARNPKLVSVELGANEVLDARSGIAVPGVTIASYDEWRPVYDKILDSVQNVTKMGVVVGLIDDIGHVASFRTGAELYADGFEFLQFNVVVSEDCKDSPNLIFVPVKVPVALATGGAYARAALGTYTLSCAGGGSFDQDYVLVPGEAGFVNSLMHDMTAHIQSEAARRGFAYFALGELYDHAGPKAPFSLVGLLTSGAPYGEYFSLDGLHPSAAGQTVLARAAAQSLNATYSFGIPLP